MIRLFYFSHATQVISDEQVRDILKTSRRNNPLKGISGVLVHGGGLFAQILEGPEQTVLRLYAKILDDRRHSDCRIVHISPANERMFQKWSMGVINSAPWEFQNITELKSHRQGTVHSKAFTDAMSGFLRTLNAAQHQDAPPQ